MQHSTPRPVPARPPAAAASRTAAAQQGRLVESHDLLTAPLGLGRGERHAAQQLRLRLRLKVG